VSTTGLEIKEQIAASATNVSHGSPTRYLATEILLRRNHQQTVFPIMKNAHT